MTLSLLTLGSASLTSHSTDGAPEKILKTGKPLALIIYLAASAKRTASREHLIDTLWADVEPERGLRTLRQTVWQLRQSFGEDVLTGEVREITLTPNLKFDRDEFLAAVANGDYDKALSLYQGPFIPDFGVPGGADFEQWADRERDRLHSVYLRSAEVLIRTHLDHARYDKAIAAAHRLRDSDPDRESSWRLLLEALSSSGDRLSTLGTAEELERFLASENREPERLTVSSIARAKRTLATPAKSQTAVELLVADLTGRDREFSQMTSAWTSVKSGRFRHIHISAPPGLGKTRLLQDVYSRLRAGGARAVFINAIAGDRRLAYSLASDLAGKVGLLSGASGISTAAASSVIALNPTLSSSFAATPGNAEGDEALRRRVHAVGELLAAVTEEAPLALFIDDLHWSDPVSQQLLRSVFSRIGNARLLLITSARTEPDGNLHLTSTETITLDPLTPDQVCDVIVGFGSLPHADWTSAFLEEMQNQTAGSPLLLLENLHLALDRGTLQLVNHAWECADPAALIDSISRGDVFEQRLRKIDGRLFDVLLLLAVAAEPTPSSIAAVALARDRAALEADLSDLEQQALANSAAEKWRCAHDAIAESAIVLAGEEKRKSIQSSLGAALASPKDADAHHLRLALHHLVESGHLHDAERVFQRAVAMARESGDRRSSLQFATAMVGDSLPSQTAKRLVGSLPLLQRAGVTSPWRVAAVAVALVVAIVVPLQFMPAKPARLSITTQPLSGTSTQIVPSPVVEIQDRNGNRVANASDTVTVKMLTGENALEGTRSVVATGGRAIFTDLFLGKSLGNRASQPTVLSFRMKGLVAVTAKAFNLPNGHSTLRLVSGVINGQTIGPSHRVVVVRPGELISGSLQLRYSSLWGSASVILGATPTWGDRTHDFVDLAPLATPEADQPRRANIRFAGPDKPGTYHIVVAFDAEGNVEDFMSGTNWRMPKPVWNDGNDIVDWNQAQLAHANAFGWVDTTILKIDDLTKKVAVLPHPVPATVIDVVVR